MAKSASKVFKSIRFAKLDPDHQKAGPFSTDDEEHYTVSTQEYDQQIKHVKKRAMQEDLRKWFDKDDPEGGWKRINSKGEAIGPCAREPGEPKPKCMSNEKRAQLTKKERASAVAAKRKHDPNPERKGEPINVSNFGKGKISEDMEQLDEKNVPTSPEKWAQAKAQAKAKFDVYPSAYANGWASKKYKEMGGGWKSVSEETIDEACWDTHKKVGMKMKGGKMVPDCVPKNESVKEIGDDPTGSSAQETLMKKGGKTTVVKPIAEATSVAVRMQRALDRIKAKREASEQRGREVLQPKKPEPVKEGWKADSGWHKSDSKTDTVTDKSGAVHTAQSKVRDLARRAMKDAGAKQAKSVGAKPMKESTLVESRKTDIIKDVVDSAKKKKKESDKFEANPTLDSQIQKVDNT